MTNTMLLPACLVFLTLCCQTGSLFMVDPTEQTQYTKDTATIECHFTERVCPENPTWSGPAVRMQRAVFDRQGGISTLTIHNLTQHDEGRYDCSCSGQPTQTSTLIVLRAPFFYDVEPHQRFSLRRPAVVMCRADLGDPEVVMKWTKNGFLLPNPQTPHIQNSSYVLHIGNISESDAGIYQCEFHTTKFGRIFRTVNVSVTEPPLEFTHPSDATIVPFGDALNLECATQPSAVEYSWTLPRRPGRVEQTTSNRTIHLSAHTRGGFAGYYTCTANTSSGVTGRQTVHVQQINIPPRLAEQKKTIITVEGDPHELHLQLKFPVLENGLTLQWTKNNESIDFSSRISYYVPQDGLRIEIRNAEVNDAGTYQLNISNNHGYDVLNVTLHVNPLPREYLKLIFTDVLCKTLEAHTSEVGVEVWRQYCNQHSCNGLRMDRSTPITLTCRDTGLTVLTLGIIVSSPSASLQDIRNEEFSVTVSSAQLTGTVCQSGESEDSCGPATTPPSTPTNPGPAEGDEPTSATTVIAVVSLTLVMAVVLVALLLAVVFWRSRRNHW